MPTAIGVNEFSGEFVGSEAALSAGGSTTCGMTGGGVVYCWGGFEISGNSWAFTPGPIPIPFFAGGAPPFASVTAGGGHSCAVTAAGVAYCWGANWDGQLGDGTRLRSVSFVRDTLRVAVVPVLSPQAFASLSAG